MMKVYSKNEISQGLRPLEMTALILAALMFVSTDALATKQAPPTQVPLAQTSPVVEPVKELRYAPIRIEVTESKLNPEMLKIKKELVEEHSQVLEDLLHKSGAVYRDPELEQAIAELIPLEKMGENAKGFFFRIYLLKDPNLNAMTTPSGSIYVNSGLLATLDNFEELRAVMAHEAHHAIDQDIVYKFKTLKDETTAVKLFNLLAAPAIAYAIKDSNSDTAKLTVNIFTGVSWGVGIAYQLSLFGYGRGHEIECDEYALNLLHKQGHNVSSIKSLFEKFDREQQRFGNRGLFQSHLFATHETGKQRVERVNKFAKEHGSVEKTDAPAVDKRYNDLTKNTRLENARLNIRIGRVQHAIDDLERLKKIFPDEPRVMNGLGEAYSKLTEDRKVLESELSRKEWNKIKKEKEEEQRAAWIKQAEVSFQQAIGLDPNFPEPYRGQALLKETLKENEKAVELFEKYATLAPQAKDKRYIQAKIKRLREIINIKKEALRKTEVSGENTA